MNPVHLIGVDPETRRPAPAQASRIDKADVIAGGDRLLALFTDRPGRRIPLRSPLGDVLQAIGEAASQGEDVVVLADGDPGFFGIGRMLVERFGRDAVVLHPAVTVLQLAAARLKIPWQDIRAVSLHGREDRAPLMRLLVREDRVAVYTGPDAGPARIARDLTARGVDAFRMHVFEDLGGENERLRSLELEEVPSNAFAAPNFVILERTRRPELPLRVGVPDDLFLHQGGLITKKEVRAVGLSSLEIEPGHTVWDLGAGCGAVAIEASVLAHQGRVFAVERVPERLALIRENIRRTGAYLVEPVCGDMRECLGPLPDPDRIFMGGGLSGGGEALEAAVDRVKPGGRLVLHLVLLGSVFKALKGLASRGWDADVTHVQAGRSARLASDLRIEALNPVYVVSARKPGARQDRGAVDER